MKQKITLYALLLLVCRSLAAEPIHKPDNTTAAHPSISPKNVETIPTGPANRLFGAVTTPAPITARAIGSYARGCLAGGVSLPSRFPEWQVMRVSRNRNWGHPRLLDFLERFAADALHPAIKKVLCEQAGHDRGWLAKVRPWWNYYHFHVRVTCPPGASDCEGQKPVSSDDGCGQELTNWFANLKKGSDCRNCAAIGGAQQAAQVSYHGEASARMRHSAYRWWLRATACQRTDHAGSDP